MNMDGRNNSEMYMITQHEKNMLVVRLQSDITKLTC